MNEVQAHALAIRRRENKQPIHISVVSPCISIRVNLGFLSFIRRYGNSSFRYGYLFATCSIGPVWKKILQCWCTNSQKEMQGRDLNFRLGSTTDALPTGVYHGVGKGLWFTSTANGAFNTWHIILSF